MLSGLIHRLSTAELRFWVLVVFGLALVISTGPAYTLPLPPLPGLAWKRVVAADLLFGLLILLCLLPSRPAMSLGQRGVWITAAAMMAAIGLTVVVTPRPSAGIPHLGRIAYSLTLFVIVASMRLSMKHLRIFALTHTAVAALVSILAVGAYLLYRTAGVASPLISVATEPGWSLGSSVRAAGPFAHPTTFVVFLHAAFFYALVLLRLEPSRPLVRRFCGASIVVFALALPLAYSRAMLAPVLALFVIALTARSASRLAGAWTVILGQLTAVGLALMVISHVWNVFPVSSSFDADTKLLTVRLYGAHEERFYIYSAALQMFLDSPLVGVGPGHFGENIKRYVTLSEYREASRYYLSENVAVGRWRAGADPHSSWFGWLARSGLVGIGAMAALFGWVLWRLARRARGGGPAAEIARLATAFMVGFLLLGFMVEIIHLKLLWLFMGLTLAATESDEA